MGEYADADAPYEFEILEGGLPYVEVAAGLDVAYELLMVPPPPYPPASAGAYPEVVVVAAACGAYDPALVAYELLGWRREGLCCC